jgi:SHS family lactate transporter-like MFS transporter
VSFIAAWAGWVLDAFDFTIFLLAMPMIASEFGVSLTATAGSVTLTLLLRLVGGVAAGAAADRWGRRLPLMIAIAWFAICDGLVSVAPTFTWIIVLRTLFGLGMGAEWASGATLAMENWPQKSRGIASGLLQGSWAVGYLLAAVVAGYVLPLYGFRTLFLIAAAPALLILPIRFFVPDTHPSAVEKAEPAHLTASERGGLGRTLVWSCLIMGLAFAAYYGLTALYPAMLQKQLHVQTERMSALVALFNVGMLTGAVITGTIAAKKSPMLAITLPAVLSFAMLPLYVGFVPELLPLGAFLGGMLGAGYVGVTPLLLTAMFPARVRGRAVGFVYHVGACFAAVVPPLTAALAEKTGLGVAIAASAGGLQLLLLVALAFRPRDIFDSQGEPDAPALSLIGKETT